MRKVRRLTVSIIVLTAIAMALAACSGSKGQQTGGAGEAAKGNLSSEQPKSTTKLVDTVNGKLEIPLEPKRIIAQGYLATFLALGLKPVGAPNWDIDSPHISHLTAGIEDIGTIDTSSIEKILSLNPDLIVTLSDDPVMYEQLSKIAPTVVLVYNTFKDARDEVRTFGELLGKEQEAADWIASFDETVAVAKGKIKGIVGKDETVSVMGAFDKGVYVYSYGVWRGVQAIYDHLELKRPPLIEKMNESHEEYRSISWEKIPEVAGDYIFLEAGENGTFDREGAFWKTIPAVKNKRVYDLDTKYFWPFDPIAVKAQVEMVADMLVQGQSQ